MRHRNLDTVCLERKESGLIGTVLKDVLLDVPGDSWVNDTLDGLILGFLEEVLHIRPRELKLCSCESLLHTVHVSTSCNGIDTTSKVPGEDDLRRGHVVALGDVLDDGVLGVLFHILAATERTVGLNLDLVGLAIVQQLIVGDSVVDLDLVSSGQDLGRGEELLYSSNIEVTDSDISDLSLLDHLLEVPPRLHDIRGEDMVLNGTTILRFKRRQL